MNIQATAKTSEEVCKASLVRRRVQEKRRSLCTVAKDFHRTLAARAPSMMTVSSWLMPAIWQVGWMSQRLAPKASAIVCQGCEGVRGWMEIMRSRSWSLSFARESLLYG